MSAGSYSCRGLLDEIGVNRFNRKLELIFFQREIYLQYLQYLLDLQNLHLFAIEIVSGLREPELINS